MGGEGTFLGTGTDLLLCDEVDDEITETVGLVCVDVQDIGGEHCVPVDDVKSVGCSVCCGWSIRCRGGAGVVGQEQNEDLRELICSVREDIAAIISCLKASTFLSRLITVCSRFVEAAGERFEFLIALSTSKFKREATALAGPEATVGCELS